MVKSKLHNLASRLCAIHICSLPWPHVAPAASLFGSHIYYFVFFQWPRLSDHTENESSSYTERSTFLQLEFGGNLKHWPHSNHMWLAQTSSYWAKFSEYQNLEIWWSLHKHVKYVICVWKYGIKYNFNS